MHKYTNKATTYSVNPAEKHSINQNVGPGLFMLVCTDIVLV